MSTTTDRPEPEADVLPGLQLEWLILADAVDVVGGKLYLLGGGWDILWVKKLPVVRPVGVGVAVRVPWHLANQRHDIRLVMEDEAKKALLTMEGQFEVGRPAGMPAGQSQLAQFAANAGLQFEQLGLHQVRLSINGEDVLRTYPFRVAASSNFSQT